METIKIKFDSKCTLIAHRGLAGIAPENSLEAFQKSAELGYYGLECDFHVTKDKQFVVFHDHTLERMTSAKGFIKDLTYDEIKKININTGSNINLFSNVKIPLLTEYLDICVKYDVIPVIEIKEVNNFLDLDDFIELIKDYNLLKKVIIISFNLQYLIYLKNKFQNLNIQYLVNEINLEVINTCSQYHFDVDVNYGKLTQDLINECHRKNILVNVWTVDDVNIAKTLANYGVDFITTNILYDKE